jgi:hypothetical protein
VLPRRGSARGRVLGIGSTDLVLADLGGIGLVLRFAQRRLGGYLLG